MRRIYIILLFLFVYVNGKCQDRPDHKYLLIEASRSKAIGDYNSAIKLYRNCLEINSKCDVAAYELGSIYAMHKQYEISESFLKQAFDLDNSNYWYITAYTEILEQNKKYYEASDIIKKYLKKEDDNKLKYSLANIYYYLGKTRKSLKLLNEIENANGISDQIIFRRVEIYKNSGEYEKGEKELLRLIEIMPEIPDYKILMAEYLEDYGQSGKAKEYYEIAYNQDTTNVYSITSLAEYYTNKQAYEKGFFYLKKAMLHPAIKVENKINTIIFYLKNDQLLIKWKDYVQDMVEILDEVYPDEIEVKRICFDFYDRTGNFEKAYIYINQLINIDNSSEILWQEAVLTASILKKFDDIICYSDSAIKIFPENKEFYLFKGMALYQKNMYQEAYDILTDNYEIGLDIGLQIQYLTFLGESAYNLEKLNEAFNYFEELLLLDPGNIGIMNNYAYYISLSNGNLKRAKELSQKTIKVDPENPVFLDTYGWILYKLGDFEGALENIKRAGEKSGDSDILFHLAEIYFKMNEIELAKQFYKKALENGFDEEVIRTKLSLCN